MPIENRSNLVSEPPPFGGSSSVGSRR
ncbi:unnamed protein product [Victoria cruziana]